MVEIATEEVVVVVVKGMDVGGRGGVSMRTVVGIGVSVVPVEEVVGVAMGMREIEKEGVEAWEAGEEAGGEGR